ncbi:MAG: enoyl-CoA hydratase/carnithine racemase [Candidatus Azotimanducaceae bacterium]|jgi:enoyl-CoA hydratase/carnithine racemase
MSELVITVLEKGIGELILNRPKQRNSLTGPLVNALQKGLEQLLADDDCRAIIIRGQNGYFCAGLDVKAFFQEPEPEWKASFTSDWTKFHKTVFYANKPIIGAIEGFALAGGSGLALACDFLIIGEKAFFHVLEVERGMLAPFNVLWLSFRFSYRIALKLALLGERQSGQKLVDIGVADICVPDDEVLSAAREMAERFAGFDAKNTQRLKRSIRAGRLDTDFDKLLAAIKA